MTTILIVEDSAVDRRVVGGLLTQNGQQALEYASNGTEALARMKESVPDLIITDLQMPEMDGLELVAATRVHYPDVPVILVTAFGSELLATEALEKGAASYVPKSRLAEKLSQTVADVLALATAQRSYNQLIHCLSGTRFDFVLENHPPLVDALVNLVQEMALGTGFCDRNGRLQIGVALKEALSNALYHGNLELGPQESTPTDDVIRQRREQSPYDGRKIFVNVTLSPDEARFVIRDEGPGFDVSVIPEADDPSVLTAGHGRGFSLMRSFMDEVTYNDAGNEVTMVKRCQEETPPPGGDDA